MDKLLKLLDNNSSCSAVIAAMVDWVSAFDRQDPTLAIEKYIKMGVRPALIPVLVSYLFLFVRSLLEYCSTVWHSTLTVEQTNNIEHVQKIYLKKKMPKI